MLVGALPLGPRYGIRGGAWEGKGCRRPRGEEEGPQARPGEKRAGFLYLEWIGLISWGRDAWIARE